MPPTSQPSPSPRLGARVAAAAVHLYTAVGGVLAFFALVDIAVGRFERALLLLGIAFVIDATDGFMARRLRVKEALPTIDGATLDLVIDFVTYALAPLFLLWCAALLPKPAGLWATLILIAACYDFANTHPLKDYGLYTGLPAIWNLYAFHVYYLQPSAPVQIICISCLAVLTFAPVHFICLSRLSYLRSVGLVAATAYIAVVLAVLTNIVDNRRQWALVALAYPIWYLGSSFWIDFKFRNGSLPDVPPPLAPSGETR